MDFNNLYMKLSELKFQNTPPSNNFYLPFTNQKNLDLVFFIQDQVKQYKDFLLYPNTNIAGVYGNFSNIIWNGGRSFSNSDFSSFKEKKQCIDNINNHSMICKFTFTNSLLEEHHCKDIRCNQLLNLIADTNNEITIYSNILEQYIKNKYPTIGLTSSITKGNTLSVLQENLQKDYKMVVCFYKRNILEYINTLDNFDKNRIELLLNDEGCAHCQNHSVHFQNESYNNLYNTKNKFKCIKTENDYKEYEQLLNLPIEEQLFYNIQYFQDIGIHNYKIRGRGLSTEELISIYITTLFQQKIHKTIYINFHKYGGIIK